jgi:predicted DCC family thiol-disulfide oxidoreductase YuxK
MGDLHKPVLNPEDQIILFDGVCKLCNYWTRFILRFDKQQRFKLCAVQSPQGQALLAQYNFPLDKFETLLLIHNGAYLTHSDAIIAIVRGLPFPWTIIAVVRWLPKRLRDAGYRFIARNRYRIFGRYDQCVLPPEGYQKRFLDL